MNDLGGFQEYAAHLIEDWRRPLSFFSGRHKARWRTNEWDSCSVGCLSIPPFTFYLRTFLKRLRVWFMCRRKGCRAEGTSHQDATKETVVCAREEVTTKQKSTEVVLAFPWCRKGIRDWKRSRTRWQQGLLVSESCLKSWQQSLKQHLPFSCWTVHFHRQLGTLLS